MTDHERREAALAYARELLLRVDDLFDLPRALEHANTISDILHDHRQQHPGAAVSIARQWADQQMDGWRNEIGGTSGPAAPNREGASAHMPVTPFGQRPTTTEGGGASTPPPPITFIITTDGDVVAL